MSSGAAANSYGESRPDGNARPLEARQNLIKQYRNDLQELAAVLRVQSASGSADIVVRRSIHSAKTLLLAAGNEAAWSKISNLEGAISTGPDVADALNAAAEILVAAIGAVDGVEDYANGAARDEAPNETIDEATNKADEAPEKVSSANHDNEGPQVDNSPDGVPVAPGRGDLTAPGTTRFDRILCRFADGELIPSARIFVLLNAIKEIAVVRSMDPPLSALSRGGGEYERVLLYLDAGTPLDQLEAAVFRSGLSLESCISESEPSALTTSSSPDTLYFLLNRRINASGNQETAVNRLALDAAGLYRRQMRFHEDMGSLVTQYATRVAALAGKKHPLIIFRLEAVELYDPVVRVLLPLIFHLINNSIAHSDAEHLKISISLQNAVTDSEFPGLGYQQLIYRDNGSWYESGKSGEPDSLSGPSEGSTGGVSGMSLGLDSIRAYADDLQADLRTPPEQEGALVCTWATTLTHMKVLFCLDPFTLREWAVPLDLVVSDEEVRPARMIRGGEWYYRWADSALPMLRVNSDNLPETFSSDLPNEKPGESFRLLRINNPTGEAPMLIFAGAVTRTETSLVLPHASGVRGIPWLAIL